MPRYARLLYIRSINRTQLTLQDLSLLVDLKYEDLQKLQAVGAKAQAEQAKFILRNDLPKVWETLKGMNAGRVDIVLDNGELPRTSCCDLLMH